MIKNYDVSIIGCDDHNDFVVPLTDEQYMGVLIVAAMAGKLSEYDCQPIIEVKVSK